MKISTHAAKRMNQRGVRRELVEALIATADIEMPVGNNCRLLRVSQQAASAHSMRDKLKRFCVVVSDDSQAIVTVKAIYKRQKIRRAA